VQTIQREFRSRGAKTDGDVAKSLGSHPDDNETDPRHSSIETRIPAMNSPTLLVYAHEAKLVQRACAGDKEAFYQLVHPCERAIFTSAMSVLRNEADAEEASQEAVLKAFCAVSRFRGECKFSTWLTQITINEARAKLRKDRRGLYESIDDQWVHEDRDWFPKDYADWREIPSEELQRKELGEALKRALESLPQRYREVLVLRDVQHLSTQEAAHVLGITRGSVKIRLFRARLQMRNALAPGIDGSWATGRLEFEKVRPFVE
jgi:RNA polymerase sigma-70 factor, ECF subfamily